MDWIIWLIVIVVIVAVIWWLLNRNSRSGAGTSAADTGKAAAPLASPTGPGTSAPAGTGPSAAPVQEKAATAPEPDAGAAPVQAEAAGAREADAGVGPAAVPRAAEGAEWETQWSETPPQEPQAVGHHEPPRGEPAAVHGAHVAQPAPAEGTQAATGGLPVHHPEYTEPHAPTLPGAESAAAETASETAADHSAEPSGHLAVDQPYGEGSAAPAADGSAPEGFTVKGNASSMTYHDETSPSYEETRAEVWFLSPAHAEAAGFRPPRRTRQ